GANPGQFWRTRYSDVPVGHVTSTLAEQQLPYSGSGSNQPLLSGLVMWLVSVVSPRAGTDVADQQSIFATWAAFAVLLLAVAVLAGIALLPEDPWHIAHLAASPVLVVLALVSTDLVGVALVLWGWLAWSRGHPAVAGSLMGLAFLVRPYPLIFLLAIVLVAVRHDQVRAGVTALVSAALAGLAAFVPALLLVGDGLLQAPREWWSAGPGYGAPALIPQLMKCSTEVPWCGALDSVGALRLSPTVATVIAVSGWVAALIVGAWLALRSVRRPDAVRVAAIMLLIVALTAKSLSVQTGLWVLPVLALSAVRWRDHLIWADVEILHFVATWLHIGFGSDAG